MSSTLRPDAGPAEDDGAADPRLAEVLASFAAGQGVDAEVLTALVEARLIVPITAVSIAAVEGGDGVAGDKAVEMALPVMIGTDGRRALPAFTSLAAMASWDPSARPVPVAARRAAQGAVQEDCAFLVVDPAGPVTWVADRAQVELLAREVPPPTT